MIDLDGMEVLGEEECRRLLGEACLGRIGICVGALPAILPVNYIMAGDEVLFFTAAGTKLRAATDNAIVSFEVDHFDAVTRTGWSVLVVGRATERDEPALVRGAMVAGLRPWVSGDRPHLVSLATELVSGRRIIPHPAGTTAGTGHHFVLGPSSRVGVLARAPLRVGSDWTLQTAAAAMRAANVSSALVGRDEAIITERDLTRALTIGLGPAAGVTAVCVTDFVSVDQDVTIIEAAKVMLDYDVRHLTVGNSRGDVMGIVSLRDLLRVFVAAMDPAIWVVLGQRLSMRGDVNLG